MLRRSIWNAGRFDAVKLLRQFLGSRGAFVHN
jgi:hypothetical protein